MARFPYSAKTAQHVRKVLSNSGTSLGKLMQHATHLAQLETLIRGFLHPDLASQFQVASVRKNRLILITPSAAWATRLRMQTPQLITSLRDSGKPGVEFIDIRVAPLVLNRTEQRSRRVLSSAAKQALDLMAHVQSKARE